MELQHDWKVVERVFLHPSSLADKKGSTPKQNLLLVDQARVHAAWAKDGRDLSSLHGMGLAMALEKLDPAHCTVIARDEMDSWVEDSMDNGNFMFSYEQSKKRGGIPHFLLNWISHPGWSFGVPASIGLLLRLQDELGEESEEVLLIRKDHKLSQVTQPDLSAMGPERVKVDGEVLKFLGERHSVPIQILEMSLKEWDSISKHSRPWQALWKGMRSGSVRLFPERSRFSFLVARNFFYKIFVSPR